jgi:glycosyltransferase involved in cell wall biosynthesis
MARSVLLLLPHTRFYGGAELVAAWMLQALAGECDLTVLSPEEPVLEGFNRWYSTTLSESDFESVLPPKIVRAPLQFALARTEGRHALQQYAVLMRIAKRIGHRYDVVVNAFDQADLGPPGIQYVAEHAMPPALYSTLRSANGLRGQLRASYRVRLRPWKLISGFSYERMRRNLTLVNSDWTGREMQRVYGIDTTTLYPPVPGPFHPRPWKERRNTVVCVGRLDATKRIERMIEIVSRARSLGGDLSLDIVGFAHANQDQYLARLRDRVRNAGSWVALHENLPRADLLELLAASRYGLHGMQAEPFGIAVAEMARSGCIVFTPPDGGQVEIATDPALVYDSVDDAAERLLAVARSPGEQERLHDHVMRRGELFSEERFVGAFRSVVRTWPASSPQEPGRHPCPSRGLDR